EEAEAADRRWREYDRGAGWGTGRLHDLAARSECEAGEDGRPAVPLQLDQAAAMAAQSAKRRLPRAADGRGAQIAEHPHGQPIGLHDDRIYPPQRGGRLWRE